ncbi:MAG: UbiA family prenyltransferase [Opitutales bacterium]|nr:UbiA family prenyltransferase [Opitutales bacterium]
MNFFKSAVAYADLIKLGHTLFALPFALSALCLAYLSGHSLSCSKIFWVILAFAGARASAMGFNRIVDRDVDALNPRTKNRPSVTGKISIADAKVFTIISIVIFFISAGMINWLCFVLAFPALAVLLGYSYAKRFTFTAHYIVGVALAIAPAGAWIAVADSLSPQILTLSFALLFNIASFDLIYALQDMEFDKSHKLHSIPAKFGRKITLILSGISFVVATICLIATGVLFDLNKFYFICVAIIAVLYAIGEFAICKYGETKTQLVFFYENVAISLLIFIGIVSNIL